MNKYKKAFLIDWKRYIVIMFSVVVIIGILLFQLGRLTGQANKAEVSVYKTNVSYRETVRNPINAPYYVVRNSIQKLIKPQNIVVPRFTSVLFAALVLFAFFSVLSLWYETRMLVLGTLLFASSSWFLHIARIGLPVSMQSLGIILVLLSAWLHQTKKLKLATLCMILSIGFLVYIPGMIWLILAAILWKGKALKKDFSGISKKFILFCICLISIIVTPLLWAVFKNPSVLFELTGFPNTLNIQYLLSNLYNIPLQIFIRATPNSISNIGNLPLLDVFTTAMFVIGVYANMKTRKLDRSKLTFGLLFIGILFSTLVDSPLLPMMIVPIYLFAVSGVSFMLDEWFTVFPRNPLAKGIATTLISILVLSVAYYHITSYFIAWPNNTDTKSSFSERI